MPHHPPHPKKVFVKKEEKKDKMSEEIKNTVFRMNRRLFHLEREVEPLNEYMRLNIDRLMKKVSALDSRQGKVHEVQTKNLKKLHNAHEKRIIELEHRLTKAMAIAGAGLGIAVFVIIMLMLMLLGFI